MPSGTAPRSPLRDAEKHLRDPAIKQRYATTVFEIIAPGYDRFTRYFSFGMDAGWKRELLGLVAESLPTNALVVDLACGTGDLAFGVASSRSEVSVLGIDASHRMIEVADARRRRSSCTRVRFYCGDMVEITLPDESVDAVTVGYGLRNAPELGPAVAEIARVLKPGGRLYCLDFYKPESPLWRTLWLRYLAVAGAVYGWWWHRDPAVYGYIARSIRHSVSSTEFSVRLEERGLSVETVRRKLAGGVCLHVACKAADARGGCG